MASRARRGTALVLAAGLALGPGCRATGELAYGAYDWGAAAFAPNPATTWTYFGGLGLFFVAASPLLLLSWPLTALLYPDGEDAYETSAALAPATIVGSLGGTLLSLPFYPFGLPFLPDEPAPPAGPPPAEPPPAEPSPGTGDGEEADRSAAPRDGPR